MSSFASNPIRFRGECVVSPPVQRKTQGEILKEKTHEQARDALKKPSEQRNVGDYMTIALDTAHSISDNMPVLYANGSSKLNYMA